MCWQLTNCPALRSLLKLGGTSVGRNASDSEEDKHESFLEHTNRDGMHAATLLHARLASIKRANCACILSGEALYG